MLRKTPLLYVLLMISVQGWTQVPYFQSYFLLNKNEPVQVNAIFQDRSGFVWIGTNRGLFRFDGKETKQFTSKEKLPDDNVTALAQDSAGSIWVGTASGKIAYMTAGTISLFETREGNAGQQISDIHFDSKGVLWFATLNDGLYYFKNDRLFRLDEQEGMPDLYVYDIQEDYQGRMIAGTDGGIAICALKDNKVAIEVINHKQGLPDNIVKKIVVSGDGLLWLATEDAGIISFDPGSRKFKPLFDQPWGYGSIMDVLIKGSKFWIATTSGLIVYDTKSFETKNFGTRTGLNLPTIHALLKDREGNIWAGSKAGLARTTGDHLEFSEGDENVLALIETDAGKRWYSTTEGLFERSVRADGSVSVVNKLSGTPYSKFQVISLYESSEGSVWAGLYGEGLLRFLPNGSIQSFTKQLRNGNILSITGRDNTIWLATLGGAEQLTLSGHKVSIRNISKNDGLSSDFIYQVFLDSRNRTWFATDGKGIDMMDAEGFHRFEELGSNVVYGIAEDSRQNIWINVQGKGLYKLDGGNFISMDSVTNFRDNNIAVIGADAYSNIVVMHDLGIDLFNVETGKVRYLGEESGVRERRATLNALSKDPEGRMLIGTNHGMIRLASAEDIVHHTPEIIIESVKVFDQDMSSAALEYLSYDENNITIDFVGFWFQDPVSVRFLYKMENYDQDWLATANNSVTYSRLPPGDYVFHVKASETSDFSHAEETAIALTIRPPFWRTNLFYIVSAIVVVFAGYSFLMYRERSLIREKHELEAKVAERTREIQRKTEEIQAQNEEISAQAEEIKGINENLESLVKQRTAQLEKKNLALQEYAFINAHKLRSPVASILGLINLISKTSLDPQGKEINEHLQKSAEELDKIVSSITKAIEKGEREL